MEIGQLLGSITVWTGTFVGVLKLADWLLSSKQKKTLASWATTVWIWLDDQRLGRFTAAVKSIRAQRVFSVAAHAYITYVLLALLGKIFLGWNLYVVFRLGQPRIYPFQVWVEAAAMMCSMILLTWTIHPRIA